LNTLITFKVDGEKDARVLVRGVQLDPISHHLLHADFYRVNLDRKITVTVPVHLVGEARGVKTDGGVLDCVHREMEVECLPTEIPNAIEVDISNLGIGDAIHVRDVAASRAWTAVSDTDMMLVHVVTIKVVEEAAPAPAEGAAAAAAPAAAAAGGAAEPEVIKKGKAEKEGDEKAEKKADDKKK
jgi:large subunit ribosomal protein L25